MSAIISPPSFRQYAAPREHGTALVDPPLEQVPLRIASNRRRVAQWDLEIAGHPIAELRHTARQDLVTAAVRYVRAYRNVTEPRATALDQCNLVMAGHQPELFHPGVWFKNFVLSTVASPPSSIAINLIVDNDLCATTAVRAPSWSGGRLVRAPVSFDEPSAMAVPFEQRWIQERDVFDSFDRRLEIALQGVVKNPSVRELWPHARQAAGRCGNIGCSLAQGRHSLEGDLGLQTLELPLSVVCRSYAFAAFALALLGEMPRLRECYNRSLIEYRVAHGIRSSAHPVPQLDEQEGWLEAPLWIYGDDDPQRRAAWVRAVGNSLEISDRHRRLVRIDGSPDTPEAIAQLRDAMGPTFKLRPRALVTTMFARVVLSDLFLHGIGGAKYDQLGDTVMRRFFGIEPPEYAVLSATVLLPGQIAPAGLREESEIVRDLRDLRFSPERFADRSEIPARLVAEKEQLLASLPPQGQRAAWHRQIESLNRRMSAYLADVRQQLSEELKACREATRQSQLWASREHSFAIYPLDYLLRTFDKLGGRR